jgi:hypothetical protein
MMPINLQAIPNQEPTFISDGQQYDIRVWFDGDDMMFMDVTVNGTVVASSCPCIVGQMVLPYAYLEGEGGNFFWTTASGNNPQYENFGSGDVLLYASNAEMAAGRATIAANAQTIALASNQAA